MADRYFIDDESTLTGQLDSFLEQLSRSLDEEPFSTEVVVLLLGGGYGRGEGGIYRGPEIEGATLYNDLEFYLVTRSLRTPVALEAWCHRWEKEGHGIIGIEVEFKILPASVLRQGRPSMFYYDLLLGHRVVWGDKGFCASLPAALREPARIPALEVTRLLFNRGSGLLFSRELLGTDDKSPDSGFIERNHAKVRLALADSVLALNGRYIWSCRMRHAQLETLLPLLPPDWPILKKWHRSGVDFKLHPRHGFPPKAILHEQQEALTQVWLRTFLWTESIRLKRSWPDAVGYATDKMRIFPESPALKNAALRIRDRLRVGARLPGLFDYPRGVLQQTLALLLNASDRNPKSFQQACPMLGLPTESSPSLMMQTYRTWWQRYN